MELYQEEIERRCIAQKEAMKREESNYFAPMSFKRTSFSRFAVEERVNERDPMSSSSGTLSDATNKYHLNDIVFCEREEISLVYMRTNNSCFRNINY